jgi:hypothetical protein
LELLVDRQKANFDLDKGAMEGTIQILRGQLQHKESEGASYEALLKRLQEIESLYNNSASQSSEQQQARQFLTDTRMREQDREVRESSNLLLEQLDANLVSAPSVKDYVGLSLRHLDTLLEEFGKEKDKNAKLSKRLDQELENEDTLLVTMDSLEKQISQISSSTRALSYI